VINLPKGQGRRWETGRAKGSDRKPRDDKKVEANFEEVRDKQC
jgi:hypothetical protein